MKPRIGLFPGDPSGIGPEIAAKLLEAPGTRELAEVTIIRGADTPRVELGKVSIAAGRYALESLRLGAEAIARREIDALVYAPLNKQAMKLAGMEDEDELRYLARLLAYTGYCSEINICGALWTTRVTSHVPLRAVAGLITADQVHKAARLIHRSLRASGVGEPRIAVAALNPHAGEGGLLGSEEAEEISPGIEQARAEGIDARGPFPADTVFVAAHRGDFDAVVTMYHDQGQIATKLIGFDRGVTLAAGLPAPVTTPAHGTAFDIAGKGRASIGPMQEAFSVAVAQALGLRQAEGRRYAG